MNDKKTRKIAIITDVHALLEPLQSALDDIERRNIKEVYSLGDNIGVGPNPGEVMNLLEKRGVISIAGNSEDYINFGIEPFPYFDCLKEKSYLWTLSKLDEHQKGLISLYPHSIELLIGGKKIGLCHFSNDVRFDFTNRSVWTYQDAINRKLPNPYEQFLYTNSDEQRAEIIAKIGKIIDIYGKNSPVLRGYLSASDKPLFRGRRVDIFDAIIQGHVHFKIYESSKSTNFYSIRALGIAYKKDPIDTASYVILTEKDDGYDFEEVLVKFDREKMEYSILNCDNPDKTICRYTNMGRYR